MSYIPELFESRDYATTIKVLDSMAGEVQGPALASLYCNRALCYQKMDLHRKALKNYEEALRAHPTFARAHLGRGKALQALGRTQEALAAWRLAVEGFSPADDLQLAEEAFLLIRDPASCLRRHVQTGGQVLDQAAQIPGRIPGQQAVQVANGGSAATSATTVPARSVAGIAGPGAVQPAPPGPPAAAPAAPTVPAASPAPAPPGPPRQRTAPPDLSMAVAMAVGNINGGRVDEAIRMLDDVIQSSDAPNMGALVARGTARALKRDLAGAIEDFTGSIAVYPNYADAWKRRGQARIANGDREGALQDFARALELVGDDAGRAEIRAERAMIYEKDRDLRRAVSELRASVALDSRSASAWSHLGLCLTGLGDIEAGCAAYERAIAIDPRNVDTWFHMATARKEAAHVEKAEAAFKEVFKLLKGSSKAGYMRRVYSHMKQGMGQHMEAVKSLDLAVEKASGSTRVDCLFLRGACYHALGYHRRAVEDYRKAFLLHEDGFPEETKQQQVLAFFQRELAYHAHQQLDTPVASYSLDRALHPIFKELWCKKLPPSQSQLPACQLQLPHEIPADPAGARPAPLDAAAVSELVAAADALGALLQNRHQGFLPNRRQQRMGGLAAIELAQAIRQLLEARASGTKLTVSKGATGDPGPHEFGWRDAMDIVVKWRQLSEPNDQVIWVDLLTRKEFEAGFGSHTPMFSGQTKCVRYYMNFERALALVKDIILKEGHAFDAHSRPIALGGDERRAAVAAASTAGELWGVLGEDGWAVVPIQSLRSPGETLEGTRLTVIKMPNQPEAYEMSIRTPVTPTRWQKFDEELTALWARLLVAMESGDKPLAAVASLAFVYYWYNFMPLARGTAVSGHVALLALFLAAGMPITQSVPEGYQVDWEAILQRSPAEFIASLAPWLLPEEARAASGGEAGARTEDQSESRPHATGAQSSEERDAIRELTDRLRTSDLLDASVSRASSSQRLIPDPAAFAARVARLPSVAKLAPTLRDRLEALNGPDLPRL